METMIYLIIALTVVIRKQGVKANSEDEMQSCLLELRMSELLRLQHSLQNMQNVDSTDNNTLTNQTSNEVNQTTAEAHSEEKTTEVCSSQNCMKPMAMALTSTPRGYHVNAAYHEPHPWQAEEKPSKLQTLFHISITALSFLSFGGYLLCLIVQAIKSKGTTYFHPIATASTTTPNGAVKRIKIYRRGRRHVTQSSPPPFPDDVWVMNYGLANWF